MTPHKEKGGDKVNGKETGTFAGSVILIILLYIAIVGKFNLSIGFTMMQRIWAIIGIIIITVALASGYRPKNVGSIR